MFTEDGNWTWNDDPTNPPSYFSWAEGEPNINPDADTNYVQIQQDYASYTATWFVPEDQTDTNYYICQSPKIPNSQITRNSTTVSTTAETSTPSHALTCMPGYNDIVPSSGKCYYISIDKNVTTWDDAFSQCNDMMKWDYNVDYTLENTQLVSINSEDENDQLFQQLYDMNIQSVWIGLSWNGKKIV